MGNALIRHHGKRIFFYECTVATYSVIGIILNKVEQLAVLASQKCLHYTFPMKCYTLYEVFKIKLAFQTAIFMLSSYVHTNYHKIE